VESGTIGAILAGGGALTKTTAGTVTLSGTNTYTGGTTISAGSLQYGASNVLSNSSAVTVSGGTLDIVGYDDTVAAVTLTSGDIVGTTGVLTGSSYAVESGTIGAILAGGGALTKTTAGTVTLVGENTYSGGTTVSGGTLETTVTGGLQGDITNNATVEFIDVMVSITCSSIISGTGVVIKSAFGETTISGQNTYSGGTLVSGGILKGTTTSLQGDITNNATVKFSQMGGGTYSSVISGSGALIKSDIGTVTLSGANTYTGATTVSAGSLKYGASNVLSNSSAITVSGGTLDIVNYDDTVAAVTLTSGAITGTSGVLTGSSYAVESGTISAILAGVGALTKTAAGTVTLSGANTYSGATTIDIGTLSVTGTIADSAVAINSGGTLIGSGTVGDVVVASGGTFSPGLSPGTLNSGAAVWESGGTYLWEINKATGLKGAPLGLGWDWLDITGGLSITATSGSKFNLDLSTMEVDASNFNNLQDYLWVIATASTGITSFSADKFDIDSALFTNALGGGAFGISQSGNDINLTFTAVPEPSTYALFGIGLLGLLGGWIRKKAVRTI
ncbi:MAG: autotransporter-associated beta strand repeat-containing protein, partial [Candidatus Ancaeobacter aquaticus]|nr:autotransporter-associated beta strand repeat-containing protein [Candidatus Ancaeobacter aquaticus]